MSEQSGVYVRIQNASGALWSTSRDDHALVLEDLRAAFGDEVADAIMTSLKGGFVTAAPAPALTVVPPVAVNEDVPSSDEEAIQRAEAILQQQAVPAEAAPAPQFELCTAFVAPGQVCNTPKDQWKPPGVSAAGKKYPGFFGCPNFRNHSK